MDQQRVPLSVENVRGDRGGELFGVEYYELKGGRRVMHETKAIDWRKCRMQSA